MQRESQPQTSKQQSQKQIKVLMCQINPFLKNAKNSIDRVERSLKQYSSQSKIDLVMFPQMSFVGYNYESFEEAIKLSEKPMAGESFEFCIQLAKHLKSYVGFGYIEKHLSKRQNSELEPQLFNSVAIIDPEGQLACNYRKRHLYYNDKTWATMGTNDFQTFALKTHRNEEFICTPAISSDIHPKQFVSGEHELADHVLNSKTEILLLFANWIDSTSEKVELSHVKGFYNYWLSRLRPLLLNQEIHQKQLSPQQEKEEKGGDLEEQKGSSMSEQEEQNNIQREANSSKAEKESLRKRLFLVCDRVGREEDVFAKKTIQFYGSSCAMMLNPTYVIKNLTIENEGYLMVETQLPTTQ